MPAPLACLIAVAPARAAAGSATGWAAADATAAAAKTSPAVAPVADRRRRARARAPARWPTRGTSSYPAKGAVHHHAAATPVQAGELGGGGRSAVERRSERRAQPDARGRKRRTQQTQRELTPRALGASRSGETARCPIPANVPEVVQKVIAGANAIADFPYVYGGGHASFMDNAYDCSGSVSYALAAGGLLGAPETSGELESWGVPGPGPLHHRLRKRRATPTCTSTACSTTPRGAVARTPRAGRSCRSTTQATSSATTRWV